MTKAEKMAALKAKGITVAANAAEKVVNELYEQHFGEVPAIIKAYNKIKAKEAVSFADKDTNTKEGIISVNSDSFKEFDVEKYEKNATKQSQKDWVKTIEKGDGFCTYTLEFGKDNFSQPFSILLSVLKGTKGIISDENKIVPMPETKHKIERGVLVKVN